MKEQFIQAVIAGKFDEALKLVESFSEKELESYLYILADDESNLCAYAFSCFLLLKREVIFYHKLAYLIIGFACPYLKGSAEAASHHARRIFELSLPDNPAEGARILSLFDTPDKPIEEEEAIYVAQIMLEKDPLNEQALQIISLLKNHQKVSLSGPFNDRQHLEYLVIKGKLLLAKQKLLSFGQQVWVDVVIYLAYEERNVCAYTFVWFLMQEEETAYLHYLAYRIVIAAFPIQLAGCDAVALFHIKRAMQLEPANEKYREHFIMLHTPPLGPSTLISADEVEKVIKQGGENYRFYSFARTVLKKVRQDNL